MKKTILFLILILTIQTASAAHYITGLVNNASDGENANGKQIILWNPINGIEDNLTDTIGSTGNSGTDQVYMIDCELLNNACQVGDEIRVKVLNQGDNYLSYWVNLSITGAGYDIAPNITLNSIPNTTLLHPVNYENKSNEVSFNCSGADFDGLSNITLYGNWSGWHANETKTVTGTYNQTFFIKNLSEGKYIWGCLATDNVSISNFSENYTITIDRTPPNITSISANETYVCEDQYVRVNCNVSEAFTNLNNVLIEVISPTITKNHTPIEEEGYYIDVLINETGKWKFNCIANDSANNIANLTSSELESFSNNPDLVVFGNEINFSNPDPIESEELTIQAIIHNKGCSAANNFLVGFYKKPGLIGQINNNKTLSVGARSNQSVNITWSAEIGTTNVYVNLDIENSIEEYNESNNQDNKSIYVGAWQEFYGNMSADKLLGNNQSFNITLWENLTKLQGNVFISDSEADIGWSSLQAIGRNIAGSSTGNDFSDIDTLFNMSNFNDSVSQIYTTDGNTPKLTDNFLVRQKLIENIPIITSTNTTDFITGILWDKSDDVLDGEFSQDDKEDLIFVTKVNPQKQGMYGTYDYEITIPVRLREYDSSDSSDVYLYYELN